MRNKKKMLVFPLVAAMSLSMVGCGSTEGTEATTGGDSEPVVASSDGNWNYEEGTTITLLIDTDITDTGILAVCDLAEEKLGINVEIEYRPGGTDGDNIVKTRLASGEMADICGYNSGALLSALNPSEYFVDLSQDSNIMDRLDETYASSVTVGNATYGIPVCASQAGAVMYSKPLYEKYNLEVPQTWDEFMSNCQVLQDAGETAVIGSFADSWTTQVVFLGDNANVMNKDPEFATNLAAGTTTYSDSEYALKSFEKCTDLTKFYNSDYLSTSYDDACDMIYNGEGGHWICLTQALSNIYELYGDNSDIGVFAVPADTADDTRLTTWMPTSLYANKNSENYDAVMAFMEFYISDEALDCYTNVILPDGPYCVKGYELPDNAYPAVADDMQKYFEEGKTGLAMEFITDIKGANCAQICQEAGSGQTTAAEAAEKYDADCLLQAQQLGYDWAQ